MQIRKTEFTKEYVVKEFDISQEVLDEWELTVEQILKFIEDPDFGVDNETHDLIREMFDDLEYDIYDEETNDDGEEWAVFEDE
jgi:hypothetical protein